MAEIISLGASDSLGNSGINGRVGIGTTQPSTDLELFSSANSTYAKLEVTGTYPRLKLEGNHGIINRTSDKHLYFGETADTGDYLFRGTGEVGIGTTSPTGKLDIESSSNSTTVLEVKGTGTADLVNVFDNTTEVFTILDGGNIGIGTTTPASLLHLKSNGAGFYDGIKIESQSYTDRYMLIGSGNAQGISGTNDLYLKCGDSNGVVFQRGTTDYSVLVLSSNSNIGVGTNSPSSKLDVAGDIEVGSANAFYFGAPTATVGSWRVVRSGNDLLFQRCTSTGPDVWTTKSTIAG